MSKINKMRVINLNYNNNLSRVDDEIFEFDGKSTLISLRNGGGKSVLVQMMLSLFVHGTYRNIGPRKFKDYFTLLSPTVVMVEWLLDNGAGYVLTGMLVRKRPDNTDDLATLELLDFIGEYKEESCEYSIKEIGFIEYIDGLKHLKSFGDCKKMMEQYKKDSIGAFTYYDMNQNSKNYFARLSEFGIDYKEWETIIHKINEEESGLSNLFKNVKDERGLTEKWFLKAVEDKLNEDGNLLDNYVTMVQKYTKQYRENQNKIEKRENIELFHEKSEEIKKAMNSYQVTFSEKEEYATKIYSLIEKFKRIESDYSRAKEELELKIESLSQDVRRTEHEKISCEIYELKELFDTNSSRLKNLQKVIEGEEAEREKLEQKIDILECARLYCNYLDTKKQVIKYKELLEHSKKEEKEKLPKINRLGKQLYTFYNTKQSELVNESEELSEKERSNAMQANDFEIARKHLQEEIEKKNEENGAYKEKVNNYNWFEREFNRKFDETLTRTMTGFYEEGYLEEKEEKYKELQSQYQISYEEMDKKIVLLGEELVELQKSYDSFDKEVNRSIYEKGKAEDRLHEMEEQIARRETLMQYVEASSEFLFDTEYLVGEYSKKIKEIEALIDEFRKENEKVKEELFKLKEGRLMELPKQLNDKLEAIGITAIYGMEWLSKNTYPVKRNEQIVENNPFIPYSIILSKAQIKKLEQADLDLYTSFPIPIIEKERLEEYNNSGKLFHFDGVKFYVWFNKNLLDEKKLEQMKSDLNDKIKVLEERIKEKKGALDSYLSNQKEIEFQKLSSKEYFDTKKQLEEFSSQLKALEEKMNLTITKKARKENEKEKLEEQNKKLKKQIEEMEEKREQFASLEGEYDEYIKNQEKLDQIQRDIQTNQRELKKLNELIERLSRENEMIRERFIHLDMEKAKVLKRVAKYEEYSSFESGSDSQEITDDISLLEARYDVLISEFAGEIKLLEEGLRESSCREKEEKEHLDSYVRTRNIKEEDYREVKYSTVTDKDYKERLEKQKEILKEKRNREKQVEKLTISYENKYQLKYDEMKKHYHFNELLPKSEITKINFDKKIAELNLEEQQVKKHISLINQKINNMSANITSLAEYENLSSEQFFEFEEDFKTMDLKEIDRFRGILVRDYKSSIERAAREKEKLKAEIDLIKLMTEFSDAYFQIPLSNLLKIVDSELPESILEQFARVLEASKNTMEKLNADLEIFEREKENILANVMEYIKAVHTNLSSIDKNSSIVIRKRTIKMLKINLPEWNEELVKLRLSDFLEKIKDGAMLLYDRNENTDEYISKHITTTQLYDMTIGLSNTEVNLYKIEEERETKITWKEGMKNSGGEGFLSAFVVLSSLMCYMRHGRSDLFYEKNEGKVLIMDNPFAQTTSAHLLKPLMEMAKKTNTQLICLSGIGGEDIFNRFDNIYVLNLIPSGMKKGLCVLKGEHKKRDEMIDVRVQVEESFSSEAFSKMRG